MTPESVLERMILMEVNRRIFNEKHYCHQCDNDVEIKIQENLQKNDIKGITVETLVCLPICTQCGAEIYVSEINDVNLERINQSYREATGRISVSQLEQLLENYNIGAKPLSVLLGWGECTIPRYLKGQMPNIENSNKLKEILNNPRAFVNLYNVNKHTLTSVAQRRVESALNNCVDAIEVNKDNWIAEKGLIEFFGCDSSIYNGMTKFKINKLVNSILFFINKYGEVYVTKMNKLLWYADMLCFKRNSFSVTGLQYQRINYGPVPLRYHWIYGSLSDVYFILEGTEYGTKIQTFRECDESFFLEEELQALSDVGERFKYWYAGELSDYSHKEKGYIETNHRDLISFSYAKDLSLD